MVEAKAVLGLDFICITNNEAFCKKYEHEYEIIFEHISLKELFTKVRDYVHRGYRILTHPLSGSVKPNETPFKTILLEKPSGMNKTDAESLILIENAITICEKFVNQTVKHEKYKEDFEAVDLTLAESALHSIASF